MNVSPFARRLPTFERTEFYRLIDVKGANIDAAAQYANSLTPGDMPLWAVLFMCITSEFNVNVCGTKDLHRCALPFDLHRIAQCERGLPITAQPAAIPAIRSLPHGLELPTVKPSARSSLTAKKRAASDAIIAAYVAAGRDAATQAAAGAFATAVTMLDRDDHA